MMPDERAWARWGRYAAAAVLALAVSWFAFIAHREVPILDWFDLAVHEVGHMIMLFAPPMVMFLGGSVAQVAVPLALAWYFGLIRRDVAGGGFCLAWAGASAWDVSVYIADAPVQALPLVGGGEHDWAYLLGRRGFDAMHLADEIAGFVEFTGALVAVTGIGFALSAAISGLRKPQPTLQAIPLTEALPVAPGSDPWLQAAELPFKHEQAG
ncbi:MAG: hypothetical protein V3U50_00700 [Acidimicrobiia bacterium]